MRIANADECLADAERQIGEQSDEIDRLRAELDELDTLNDKLRQDQGLVCADNAAKDARIAQAETAIAGWIADRDAHMQAADRYLARIAELEGDLRVVLADRHAAPSGAPLLGIELKWRPRIQIGFEPEQISEITIRAAKNNRSFAAEVRALVALSLAHEKVVERALGIVRDRRTAPPPTGSGSEMA